MIEKSSFLSIKNHFARVGTKCWKSLSNFYLFQVTSKLAVSNLSHNINKPLYGRHNTWLNDTQHNGIQHNDNQE